MITDRKEIADKLLGWVFFDITGYQNIVTALRSALTGAGFRTTDQDANLSVWFNSQFPPKPLPYDSCFDSVRDAFLPDTVVIDADEYIAQDVAGEDEFVYAYPCYEFCDKLQEHLDRNYYPDNRGIRDIVDPLVDKLWAAMPDPGILPDPGMMSETATLDDKIQYLLDESLTGAVRQRINDGTQWAFFPERLSVLSQGKDPYIYRDPKAYFPWTPIYQVNDLHPSAPGTVVLIARNQTSHRMREGERFEIVLPGDQFCDLVQEWLVKHWYDDHPDEHSSVESSLTQLRQALKP